MLRDANILVPDAQQQPADQDNDRGDNRDPCLEDGEYFDRQDAATMEEAINLFMDGMEAQERGGFNDLHCLLGGLPVPTSKASQALTHKNTLECSFIQSMTEEEQKQFTPSKLLLYKHDLKYRYKGLIAVHTKNVLVHASTYSVHIRTYLVHTSLH